MTIKPDDTFNIPANAISEAAAAMQKAWGYKIDFRAYALSAQTLLTALAQRGWTITPPKDVL